MRAGDADDALDGDFDVDDSADELAYRVRGVLAGHDFNAAGHPAVPLVLNLIQSNGTQLSKRFGKKILRPDGAVNPVRLDVDYGWWVDVF